MFDCLSQTFRIFFFYLNILEILDKALLISFSQIMILTFWERTVSSERNVTATIYTHCAKTGISLDHRRMPLHTIPGVMCRPVLVRKRRKILLVMIVTTWIMARVVGQMLVWLGCKLLC